MSISHPARLMKRVHGAGQLANTTMLDLTLFLASADDSMTWIEGGFPQPLPHNGTVCRQTDKVGLPGFSVTEETADANAMVGQEAASSWTGHTAAPRAGQQSMRTAWHTCSQC